MASFDYLEPPARGNFFRADDFSNAANEDFSCRPWDRIQSRVAKRFDEYRTYMERTGRLLPRFRP